MDFFSPALQTTITLCVLPIIFIAFLVTLGFVFLRRRRIKNLSVSTGIAYFLFVLLKCFLVSFLGNWLFLIVGVENPQGF